MKQLAVVAFLGVVLAACSSTSSTMNPTPTPTTGDTSDLMMPAASPTTDTTMMASPTPDMSPSPAASGVAMKAMTVTLKAQNNSSQTGTAVLTPMPDNTTKVVLTLKGGTFTDPQPAHIHVGSCPTPGAVQYPLTNVVNGTSTTIVKATLAQILATSPHLAVNVHKSQAESSTYTSCGDIQ